MSTLEAVHPDESAIRTSSRVGGWVSKARALLLPLVALIALAGLGAGIFATATRPQTARLGHEVTSLTGALTSADQQILVLQSSLKHVASQGSRLHAAVGSLKQHVRFLRYRVGGLRAAVGSLQDAVGTLQAELGKAQGSIEQLHAQSTSLLTCVPELQQELHGLKVQTTNAGGRLTSASLAKPTIVSNYCTKILFWP